MDTEGAAARTWMRDDERVNRTRIGIDDGKARPIVLHMPWQSFIRCCEVRQLRAAAPIAWHPLCMKPDVLENPAFKIAIIMPLRADIYDAVLRIV